MNRLHVATALLALSPVAFAADPATGTLSLASPTLTYASGPFAVPNVSINQTPGTPECAQPINPCDDFALTVDLPADYAASHPRDLITVVSKWAINQDAFFLYLLDASGAIVGISTSSNDPNSLSVPAVAGTYTVRIVPSNAAGDMLTTRVSLVPDQTAPAAGEPPQFTAIFPPPPMGDNTGGEMNIGFNPKTGRALTLAYLQTLRVSFPEGAEPVWEDVSYNLTAQNTNDPILVTDQMTGRTFVSQLQAGTPGQSLFAYTDDDGDSWTLTPATLDGGIDHQTVGAGPYSAGGSAGPAGDYPNAVYYCSQSVLASFCIRSDDGAATFGRPVVTKTPDDCDLFIGGIHGHVKVAADGTVYVPDRNCGGVQAVMVSEDSGDSFSVRRLPEWATAGDNDSSLGIATDGTLYNCYLSADNHVHVAVSHDKGQTWINDRDVGYAAGVIHAVFPSAAAGDPDRAACGFLGTATEGRYQATEFQGIWHPYVATTYDGGLTWHTVNASPGDPAQGTGGICLGGTTCIENRNLLDFNDATIDDRGRFMYGYDDGCIDDCVLPPHSPNVVCLPTGVSEDICLNSAARTSIARQSGGRTLFAAYDDGSSPPAKPAPVPRAAPASAGFGALGVALLLPLLLMGLARRVRIRVAGVACAVLLAGCTVTVGPEPASAPGERDWAAHLERFEQQYYEFNPPFAVAQGRHEFDGRLPDWSGAGIQKQVAWLGDTRTATLKFADAALTPTQRFEKQYLLAQIDGDLFWLQRAEAPFLNPSFYLGSLDPSVYLTRPYAPLDVRMKAFIAHLRALPAAAEQIRANLRTPLPRTFIEVASKAFGGYVSFFRKDVPPIFAEVKDAALQAELAAAIEPAAVALKGLADWLDAGKPQATEAFALGADKFAEMLRETERVTTPLAELEAIGRADLERNLAALKAACAKYAPKKSTMACIDKMAAKKPKGGAVRGARDQLDDLRAFLVSKKLVSIPGTERALVEEAPPYQRWNFAYIDIPGPYDKGMPSVYYIAPPDPTWSKADQAAYVPGAADLLFTSVHEVWPGHFLQFLHSNRSPSRFGQLFVGYAFAEGWAHYTEEMMIEAGLGDGAPEIQIGQLSNALLRDVRYLCAIGLHTQGMSVATCEKMFREEGHQDPGNARQQAARGTYDPAYLNYTLGKLMIRRLREDWTATRGGRDAWLEFHDQLLSYGGPPLPLVREQMLGTADGKLF